MSEEKKPMTATPMMAAAEFSWVDVEVQVKHAIDLLQEHGHHVINVVTGVMKLIRLATQRDLLGVFTQLNAVAVDVEKLIAAIKEEFNDVL